MKNIIYTITSILILSSCGKTVKPIIIDNPSKASVTLTFDATQTVEVGPWEEKEVEVQFGKTTISIDGGNAEEVVLDPEQNYMINPQKATYYIEDLVYTFNSQGEENYRRRFGSPKSEVEGFTVTGSFEKVDGKLVIPKTWTFGVNQDASNRGSQRSVGNEGYVIIKKIHRVNDINSKLLSNALEQLSEEVK